jgi:hypothetical protein
MTKDKGQRSNDKGQRTKAETWTKTRTRTQTTKILRARGRRAMQDNTRQNKTNKSSDSKQTANTKNRIIIK